MTIDMTTPEVPEAIFNLAKEDADLFYHEHCASLWREVVAEMSDDEYKTRSHHNVGTYTQGCRGPLCRKANREHPRRKSPEASIMALREERIYDPVLEYFHVVFKHRIRAAQSELLKEVKEQV